MHLVRCLSFVSLFTFAVPAFGQEAGAETEERAKLLFTNGSRLYEEGRYEQAIAAFEEAYDLSSQPVLLYNIANAWERLGDVPHALEALDRYRLYAPAEEQDVLLARAQALERRQVDVVAAPEPVGIGAAPVLPPPATRPVRRTFAPWVVASVGGVVAVAGSAVAGGTWVSGQNDIDRNDRTGFDSVKPLNNAAFGTAIAGSAIGLGGVVWGVSRGPAAADVTGP